MSMTDPVADMLTRTRNANLANKDKVDIPASNIKEEIARILQDEGFIKEYKRIDDNAQGKLRLYLKYSNGEKVITGLKRISKPGLRVYASKDEVPKVLGGLGVAIISTSQGVVTDKVAREKGIGGEVVCYVW
ncbi:MULTISPECIES: 30S ribosomal protein S8 [unclassified Candidatus Frackibacter]|jgi:small subunit ribosomal protein S8|uniref:30S ribosomal protein S8 n=1 Tax=unclassified Candidatus Frackibacter TaxID=2648818 RepID=UPI00079637E1|nr:MULTISPECIES: 30S ribosomal protein S8 [unclassified Candidatus Frackibacter]KXS45779.1 MAG: small subunit ribosomal protein S8 [Candidatus Frackibacter sp. T328-2]SDC22347.1 small subunit ribosomal protein S8 [Candidatus Frackibacter sp. WG11]SEM49545.1 small subunit ribosomal protein S8 [Candidatus Frackibacter sp. WG12]SFL51051.1 small subunit ribosomal protein S8 [Candidatus Frackibacter sp. WG13]